MSVALSTVAKLQVLHTNKVSIRFKKKKKKNLRFSWKSLSRSTDEVFLSLCSPLTQIQTFVHPLGENVYMWRALKTQQDSSFLYHHHVRLNLLLFSQDFQDHAIPGQEIIAESSHFPNRFEWKLAIKLRITPKEDTGEEPRWVYKGLTYEVAHIHARSRSPASSTNQITVVRTWLLSEELMQETELDS